MRHVVAWDRCGSPLLPLGDGTLIHALPVTVYQVERAVWTGGVGGLDLEAVLPPARPHAREIARARCGPALWARNLTIDEARSVARWLGGRLPSRREWLAAQRVWEDGVRFSGALSPAPAGDARITDLVRAMSKAHVERRASIVPAAFCEYATQFTSGEGGSTSVLSMQGSEGLVIAGGEATYRCDDVGFSCVFTDSAPTVLRLEGGE